MHLDQIDYLPDDVLFKTDRAGMLASLEIRTVFLNRGSSTSRPRWTPPSTSPVAARRSCGRCCPRA